MVGLENSVAFTMYSVETETLYVLFFILSDGNGRLFFGQRIIAHSNTLATEESS